MSGSKAESLARLRRSGFPVPPFFVVAPHEPLDPERLAHKSSRLLGAADLSLAVRSSAVAEDGFERSYAGMFSTKLFVPPSGVAEAVRCVRESIHDRRLAAYDAQIKETPFVVVQRMIDSEVAGVAFSRDPVDGTNSIVIDAARGVGTAVVNGECNAEQYRIDGEQRITRSDGASLLSDRTLRDLCRLVHRAERIFGAPVDVEWAIAGGKLFILQSRPITTPAEIIWDNSNISESYGGLVLPLTYTFIVRAYAGAYRRALEVVGVDRKRIERVERQLENMLGAIDGRVYYNLLNWYRLLSLVPGFSHNRRFMEMMMGVREPLPASLLESVRHRTGIREALGVARMSLRLVRRCLSLHRDVRSFHRALRATLEGAKIEHMTLAQLSDEYARLERALVREWDVPLVNDFFAALFYGLLRAAALQWLPREDAMLCNDLLSAEGSMISSVPATRMIEMAGIVRGASSLVSLLKRGAREEIESALNDLPVLSTMIDRYITSFGDRVQNELKLESVSLRDDPMPLYRALGSLACGARPALRPQCAQEIRAGAESRVARAFARKPLRLAAFRYILNHARSRVRDRENLRFERTRVFARVRAIMTRAGTLLAGLGYLDEPRDIYYLDLNTARRAMNGIDLSRLRMLVMKAKKDYRRYERLEDPPARFTSRTMRYDRLLAFGAGSPASESLSGTGCSAGVVRGRVRVIADVNEHLENGEILVTKRTDPGWVMLFPLAVGILVERGSLLSHAAIVSREMGIPSIVAIDNLTQVLHTGDLVEFDGTTGRIVVLQRAAEMAS